MTGFLDPPPPPAPVVITEDHGGHVRDYGAQAIVYLGERREIRIKGLCNSACTMALGLPTVCVYRAARLGFHLPRIEYGAPFPSTTIVPDSPEARALWMIYPGGLQSKLGALTANMRYLSGSEAIAAGIRACPE